MFAGSAYCLYLLTQKNENPYMLLGIAIPVGILAYYCWLETEKNQIIVTNDSIIKQNSIKRKELAIRNIKGYTIDKDNVFIKPISSAYPTITIQGIGYLKDAEELRFWLKRHLVDLDSAAYEEQLQTILADEDLGVTTKDRKQNLASAKKICSYLNIAGIILAIILMVYPRPYELMIPVGLLFPVICIVVFYTRIDSITMVDDNKSNAYPTLSTAIVLPASAVALRMFINYDLLGYMQCFIVVMGIAVSLVFIFFLIYKFKKPYKYGASLIVFVAVYSYAGFVAVNCMYDTRAAKSYPVTVLSKHISHGKSTTYYLEITKWGTRTHSEDESVPSSLYYEVNTGQNVNVYVKPGLLDSPWYFISNN